MTKSGGFQIRLYVSSTLWAIELSQQSEGFPREHDLTYWGERLLPISLIF